MAKQRKKPPGRKPKLTAELERATLEAIENGLRPEAAAAAMGIARSTWQRWTTSELPRYRALQAGIARARAKDEQALVDRIRTASTGTADRPGDWRAAAWTLERTRPTEYGQHLMVDARIEKEMTDGLERLRRGLDPVTFARAARLLAGEGGEEVPGDDCGDDDGDSSAPVH